MSHHEDIHYVTKVNASTLSFIGVIRYRPKLRSLYLYERLVLRVLRAGLKADFLQALGRVPHCRLVLLPKDHQSCNVIELELLIISLIHH
jgi:hypothetical protein